MDFITNLPISDGYDSIMVTVDHGSMKGVILEPCNKTMTWQELGRFYLTHFTDDMDYQTRPSQTEAHNLHPTDSENQDDYWESS